MEFCDVLFTRRSVRAYKDCVVEENVIKKLLEAALYAPSAMNCQPWSFGVIENKSIMKEISDKSKAYIISMIDKMPSFERYRELLSDTDYDIFYNAPVLILVCAKKTASPLPMVDSSLAAQNIMMMARNLNMGSCWIGFASMYLNTPEGKAKCNIPEDVDIYAPIIVGYPNSEFYKMDRNDVNLLFWEK